MSSRSARFVGVTTVPKAVQAHTLVSFHTLPPAPPPHGIQSAALSVPAGYRIVLGVPHTPPSPALPHFALCSRVRCVPSVSVGPFPLVSGQLLRPAVAGAGVSPTRVRLPQPCPGLVNGSFLKHSLFTPF